MKNEDSQHPFDERIIWKYFDGTATSEEEQELSQWLATSEKHRCEVAELRAVRQRFAKWRSTLYGPARFIRSLNRLNSRIDALENAPCTAQRPHRLSNLFGHIRIHSLLRTAAVVAVVALTGMFAWRTALMPAPITYFNADTTIMHVAMPDGSDIWLTPGSTLCYDETFPTDERRVHLDGEAYFDVEHDAEHPFIVHSCRQSVRVLGTTFNVHAYSEDENYQITLATGSLLVDGGPESRSVRLRPGEQGFFERTSGLLSLRRVNVEQVLSWQEDRLYFRAEPLASIARSLERQFNVDITIPDERLRRICFTGEFVDGENIHEIMRIISADSRILCRSRKNHFELYRNR